MAHKPEKPVFEAVQMAGELRHHPRVSPVHKEEALEPARLLAVPGFCLKTG